MRPKPAYTLWILFLVSVIFGGQKDRTVTITPDKPRVGRSITVRYNPSIKGAMLFGAESITAQVLLTRQNDGPRLLESPMKKIGSTFRTRIKLEDPRAVFGMVRFVSEEIVDDNGEMYWDFLIFDRSGQPVKGAHLARSLSYLYPLSSEFRREKDLSLAFDEAGKEEELYPDRPETQFRLWYLERARGELDSIRSAEIEKELDGMLQAYGDDEHVLSSVISWYRRLGFSEKAQGVENGLIEKDPTGEFARRTQFDRVFDVRDADQRAERALEFLKAFPDAESNRVAVAARELMSAEQYEKAEEVIVSMNPPDGNLLNALAWDYIEQEINVERGVALAEEGVEAWRRVDPDSKPSDAPRKRWERRNRMMLGYTLDTYALGLFKLGRYDEAESAYEEAYSSTDGLNANINERLVQCYLVTGKYTEAIEVTRECLERMEYTDKLLEYGQEAFAKREGSTEGFDLLVEAAKNKAIEKAREELAGKRIDKVAPDFQARNLAGDVIKLSDLAGKVVVLDFWATWCGPCKESFPFVQKVYEKYKDNSDVVILAVNTWENQEGAEREELVKKFMKDHGYTFPVVYDESQVVEKYKVQGIPTQFYIDREGTIRFKQIGFSGPEMEFSMGMMIDVLLSGEIDAKI